MAGLGRGAGWGSVPGRECSLLSLRTFSTPCPQPPLLNPNSPGSKGLVRATLSPNPARPAWPGYKATSLQPRGPPERGQLEGSQALEAHKQGQAAQRKVPAGAQPWGPRCQTPRLLPGASVACEVVSLGANIWGWVFWGPLGHKAASWLENFRKASWSKDPKEGAAIPPP